MTEERRDRVSSSESLPSATESSQSRQRKRRKWDEPAQSLGVSVPGGGGIPLYSGVASVSGALLTNPPLVASYAAVLPALQLASLPQSSATVPAKLNQPKIQDELIIAREIVINDAEASVRYKLTKRQTQEEIQKYTGAVVITRGKYRLPNASADGEKPLYLHISAGAQLKDTAERILAVDRAAAMVEEMLKQGQNAESSLPIFPTAASSGVMALSTCVYLGFEADPSNNIAARIRGPNDQYINHIMNETGVSVVLRGRGSGNCNLNESQQPLHLFLSSTNSRSLENAQSLAENLLQTISLECGASRVASAKVYNAVPPPQQLLTGVESSGNLFNVNTSSVADITSSTKTSVSSTEASSSIFPSLTAVGSQGVLSSAGGMVGVGLHQPNSVAYPQHLGKRGTSYSGYGNLYPQATPLQQVALVLRQTPSSIMPTADSVIAVGSTAPLESTGTYRSTTSSSEKERATQKRKFQELPISSKAPAKQLQVPVLNKRSELPCTLLRVKPPPKACVSESSNGMATSPAPRGMPPPSMAHSMPPPPAPRLIPPSPSTQYMAPPPPSECITSEAPKAKSDPKNSVPDKTQLDTVPETLIKLIEYGDEDDDDDDDEETGRLLGNGNSSSTAGGKPFWAA